MDLDGASWDSSLDESSPVVCCGVRVRAFVGSDETVSIVKIVSLFPRVENLNLKKVIKVLYLNQESRQCFACFSDSYAYEHFMNI